MEVSTPAHEAQHRSDISAVMEELAINPEFLREVMAKADKAKADRHYSPPAGFPVDFIPLHKEERTHVTTKVMCAHLGRREQTARSWACLGNGPLQPTRVHGRLMWAVDDIRKALGRHK